MKVTGLSRYKENKTMKKIFAIISFSALCLLSGCAQGNVAAPSAPPQPVTPSVSAQSDQTAAPAGQSQISHSASESPSTSSSSSAESQGLWQRGQIPSGAVELPESTSPYAENTAFLQTPTGNIGCDLAKGNYYSCTVQSYAVDRKYPISGDPLSSYGSTFDLSDAKTSPLEIVGRSDTPGYVNSGVGTYTVPYGQTVYYGNVVCDSQYEGLTCANIVTGQGVFMSREGYRTFTF